MNQNLNNSECLQMLKSTILDMIADLRMYVMTKPSEQFDLDGIELYFTHILHPEKIAHHAIKHILPHSVAIKTRDTEFFKTNTFIFSGLPSDKVSYYASVISDRKRFTQEHEDTLFDYFDTILAILEAYRKNK